MELAVTDGQEVRVCINFYLTDVNDQNRFQNCVRESEKAPLVRVSTKGILADMNVQTELNNPVNKTHI